LLNIKQGNSSNKI